MAFSADTSQTRELVELRNHLKWFDEERLKTARKVKELEQRFAQQGREISDRERRIQELEWQLANLAERVDRIPFDSSDFTTHGQRIMDLEWHISNLNAQLARLPKVEGELASFGSELTKLGAEQREYQSRTESGLEQRLLVEQENLMGNVHQLEAQLRAADKQTQEQLDGFRSSMSRVLFIEEELTQIRARVEEQLTQTVSQVEQETNLLIQRLMTDLDGRLQAVSSQIETVQEAIPPDVREAIAVLEQKVEELRRIVSLDMEQHVARLEEEIKLGQAEGVKLLNVVTVQEGKLAPLADQIEDVRRMVVMVEEQIGRKGEAAEQVRIKLQEFDEALRPQVNGLEERLEQTAERLSTLSNRATRLEGSVKSLADEQTAVRSSVSALNEQMSHRDKEVERQLEAWRTTLDEQKDIIDRLGQQWTVLSNQYKEARMAAQNFAQWQKQLEQQPRQFSEMLQVESDRMRSQWDNLLIEINERLRNFESESEGRWKNFEVDTEQKWSAMRHNVQQDNRDLIWRVQAAAADAIKKWPLLWLEEIEKAVEPTPNRHLPALSTESPPLRADMSVMDALEQGLIKIDYDEEVDQSPES
jgi:chromosome segregation ATPase